MHHDASYIWPKYCISLVRVNKLVFEQVGSIGPALALEAANSHLSAQQGLSLIHQDTTKIVRSYHLQQLCFGQNGGGL